MDIFHEISRLAKKYSNNLKTKLDDRVSEGGDDNAHYLIYGVLGISEKRKTY